MKDLLAILVAGVASHVVKRVPTRPSPIFYAPRVDRAAPGSPANDEHRYRTEGQRAGMRKIEEGDTDA